MKDLLETFKFLLLSTAKDAIVPFIPFFIIALSGRFIVYLIGVVLRLKRAFSKGSNYYD